MSNVVVFLGWKLCLKIREHSQDKLSLSLYYRFSYTLNITTKSGLKLNEDEERDYL